MRTLSALSNAMRTPLCARPAPAKPCRRPPWTRAGAGAPSVLDAPAAEMQGAGAPGTKEAQVAAESVMPSPRLADAVVAFWRGRMPPSYFAQVPPEAQLKHMRAVAVFADEKEGSLSEVDLVITDARDKTVTFIRGNDSPGLLVSMLESLLHTNMRGEELQSAAIFTSSDSALCTNMLSFDDARITPFERASAVLDKECLALANKVRGSEGCAASVAPKKLEKGAAAWRINIAATNVVGALALQRISAYLGLFGLNIEGGRLTTIEDDAAVIRGKPTQIKVFTLDVTWPRAAMPLARVHQPEGAPLAPLVPGGHARGTLGSVFCSELARCTKHLSDHAWELGLNTPLGVTRAEVLWTFAQAMHAPLARAGGPWQFALSRMYAMLELAEVNPLAADLASAFLARFDPAGPGGAAPDTAATELREAAFTAQVASVRARSEATVDDPAARQLLHALADCALATTRTNAFVPGRQALALRLDPSLLMHSDSPTSAVAACPHTTLFVSGRTFAGFHVRYRDVARGGLRLVIPSSRDVHASELRILHDEAQTLALAQQLKNKDIPEGGSKAVVLIEPHRASDKELVTRRCARAFVDALLDLAVPHASFADTVVDRVGGRAQPELLFLGPDENIVPEDIGWIYESAKRRGHPIPASFMSSKADAGINHKQFGVTSEGVVEFLDIALRRCKMHPDQTERPFTIKLSGGPSGDVAGNALRILYRRYGGMCSVVGLCDGTAVAEDCNGLPWDELLRLVDSDLALADFDVHKLSDSGTLIATDLPEGVRRRNQFPLAVRADAFIPAGGRPGTVNAKNVAKFFTDDGLPCCPLVVEGANLFLTPEAREYLWNHGGVTVVKDSSANKAGVTTSSFEVLTSLLLAEEEFVEHKADVIAGVLSRLHEQASLEAEMLFDERDRTGEALPHISERLSVAITRAHDALEKRLHRKDADVWSHVAVQNALVDHLPAGYVRNVVTAEPARWNAVPESYRASIVSSRLASRAVYANGLSWAEGIKHDDVLVDAVLAWANAHAASSHM